MLGILTLWTKIVIIWIFRSNVVKTHQDIDPNEVPEAAKETCQNWLFKMASIRELLPRLYMEMSLLKCYTFISKEDIKPAIARITLMIRGIGNPLVATYLRLYLCKVAANLLGNECEEFFHSNLKEFLEEYQQVRQSNDCCELSVLCVPVSSGLYTSTYNLTVEFVKVSQFFAKLNWLHFYSFLSCVP